MHIRTQAISACFRVENRDKRRDKTLEGDPIGDTLEVVRGVAERCSSSGQGNGPASLGGEMLLGPASISTKQ